MMVKRRRSFRRPSRQLVYRKLFVIAVEGMKTEPQYFAIFNDQKSVIQVKCLKHNHDSSPIQVLKRMREYIMKEGLRKSDEAWLVVDKDQWTDEQLLQLYQWSLSADNYGFALSNPKFEYWLLLHFDDGTDITSSRHCSEQLKHFLPHYNKGVDARKIARKMIYTAIDRAKIRDTPPCKDWPRFIACTTVYKLVENLLRTKKC